MKLNFECIQPQDNIFLLISLISLIQLVEIFDRVVFTDILVFQVEILLIYDEYS